MSRAKFKDYAAAIDAGGSAFNIRMLYRILVEAEARVESCKDLPDVVARSKETIALVEEKLALEDLTRDELRKLARRGA